MRKFVETIIEKVPRSRMVYPEAFVDRLKYYFWRLYTPLHPYARDLFIVLRLVRHNSRQDYLLGKIVPSATIEQLIAFLVEFGYKNHFVALEDPDEIVSLRLVDNFAYQYHLRIFNDREVRGHYEYTPEYRPLLHWRGVGMENRRNEFLGYLGDWIH